MDVAADVTIAGPEVWAFDLEHWGLMAAAPSEAQAVERLVGENLTAYRAFLDRHGSVCAPPIQVEIVERRRSRVDEEAFQVDRARASLEEVDRTIQLLEWARGELVELISHATEAELDRLDPTRELPDGAWWTTARLMAWHIAITESRYYLGKLGIEAPEPFHSLTTPLPAPDTPSLLESLAVSHDHVRDSVRQLPPDLVCEFATGETWTTRKVLRRLAWHERDETRVVRALLGA